MLNLDDIKVEFESQGFKGTQDQKRLHAGADRIYPAHPSGAVQQIRKRKAGAADKAFDSSMLPLPRFRRLCAGYR